MRQRQPDTIAALDAGDPVADLDAAAPIHSTVDVRVFVSRVHPPPRKTRATGSGLLTVVTTFAKQEISESVRARSIVGEYAPGAIG